MVWHLDVVFVHRFAIESQIVGFLLILGLEKVPRVIRWIDFFIRCSWPPAAHVVRLISAVLLTAMFLFKVFAAYGSQPSARLFAD